MGYLRLTFDKGYAAIMLSGGRDSLLAAALAVEDGYHIVPVICDNGHMEGVARAEWAVHNLQSVYGSNMVGNLVVRKTGYALLQYMQSLWKMRAKELAIRFPEVRMYQAHCLACKTTMYVSILKFCHQCGIPTLVDGVRRCQGFIVDYDETVGRFRKLCEREGVALLTPVFELASDQVRKRMLNDRGIPTKTLEPQCFLGCPLVGELAREEVDGLLELFDKEFIPLVELDIEKNGKL